MNPKVLVGIAAAASTIELATGQVLTTLVGTTALAAGAISVAPTVAVAGTGVAAALGAIIIAGGAILKGLAIAGIAGGLGASAGSRGRRFRGRRQVQEPTGNAAPVVGEAIEEDLAFALVATTEPSQCYRRLICTLATGSMKNTDLDVIPKFLSRKEVSIESPEFEFANAARLGSALKDIKACEVRYSCPLSSQEIEKLL
jgi:hypothetical protein